MYVIDIEPQRKRKPAKDYFLDIYNAYLKENDIELFCLMKRIGIENFIYLIDWLTSIYGSRITVGVFRKYYEKYYESIGFKIYKENCADDRII